MSSKQDTLDRIGARQRRIANFCKLKIPLTAGTCKNIDRTIIGSHLTNRWIKSHRLSVTWPNSGSRFASKVQTFHAKRRTIYWVTLEKKTLTTEQFENEKRLQVVESPWLSHELTTLLRRKAAIHRLYKSSQKPKSVIFINRSRSRHTPI